MTRPRTAGVEGRRRRVTHIGVADLLIALLLAGCGVASTPTTGPTSAPVASPMSAATVSPTPALDPSHTPTATAASTGVGWLAYAGSGFWISYPPEWKVQARQDETGLQLVSPSTYPFLVVLNRGPVNPATPQILAEASLIDVR